MPFINRNLCRTFKLTLGASMQQFPAQECSEVVIKSRTTCLIFARSNPSVGFQLVTGEEFTFRGVSDASELSGTGGGDIYYRTQFFGSMTDL
jgi:hypothetical protein